MASPSFHLVLLVLLQIFLLFSSPVIADDKDKDKLLDRINSYRTSLGKPPLTKNDNAKCLADKISDQLEDQPCPRAINSTSPETQFSSYTKPLEKCNLNINNVREGAILLSCTPGKMSKYAAFNFTEPQHTQYLNQSKYIGAGVGSEDDWVVVVLSANTPVGNFVASDAASLVAKLGVVRNMLGMFLGFFVGLVFFLVLLV